MARKAKAIVGGARTAKLPGGSRVRVQVKLHPKLSDAIDARRMKKDPPTARAAEIQVVLAEALGVDIGPLPTDEE